jgi:hypothetical protein
MTAVTREDIALINKALLNAYCVCSAELYHNELESVRKGNAALERITQVLEDRINQPTVANNASVDWKSITEKMYKALKSASSYISQNNPHWSAPYHNETTREIIEAISEYEKIWSIK